MVCVNFNAISVYFVPLYLAYIERVVRVGSLVGLALGFTSDGVAKMFS